MWPGSHINLSDKSCRASHHFRGEMKAWLVSSLGSTVNPLWFPDYASECDVEGLLAGSVCHCVQRGEQKEKLLKLFFSTNAIDKYSRPHKGAFALTIAFPKSLYKLMDHARGFLIATCLFPAKKDAILWMSMQSPKPGWYLWLPPNKSSILFKHVRICLISEGGLPLLLAGLSILDLTTDERKKEKKMPRRGRIHLNDVSEHH